MVRALVRIRVMVRFRVRVWVSRGFKKYRSHFVPISRFEIIALFYRKNDMKNNAFNE